MICNNCGKNPAAPPTLDVDTIVEFFDDRPMSIQTALIVLEKGDTFTSENGFTFQPNYLRVTYDPKTGKRRKAVFLDGYMAPYPFPVASVTRGDWMDV